MASGRSANEVLVSNKGGVAAARVALRRSAASDCDEFGRGWKRLCAGKRRGGRCSDCVVRFHLVVVRRRGGQSCIHILQRRCSRNTGCNLSVGASGGHRAKHSSVHCAARGRGGSPGNGDLAG